MQFVASASGYTASSEEILDAGSTLDIQSGDILVCYIAGNIGATLSISGIAEDDSSNAFTVLGKTVQWWWVGSGYLLSASASTGATIRVTLSNYSNGEWGFLVLQFRPGSGESVSFGSGPASASSSYGTNPTSAQLSTSESKSMFIGAASNDRSALSTNQIGGNSPDGTINHGSIYFDASYLEFSSAQSSIAYSTSSSSGVWGAQLICLEITTSGGASIVPLVRHYQGMDMI